MDSILNDLTGDLSLAGSGNFSLDLKAAGRKQAALAQQQPALMLGRLLQTSVALEAREIRFVVNRNSVDVRMAQPQLTANEAAQDYLQSAMVLAAALQPSELTWTPRESVATFHFCDKKQSFWDSLRQGLWQRQRYHAWLTDRSRFCPIPVYLDGCRLNSPKPIDSESLHLVHLLAASSSARQRLLTPCPHALRANSLSLAGEVYRGENSFGWVGQVACWLDGVKQATVRHRGPVDRLSSPYLPELGEGLTLANRVKRMVEDEDESIHYRVSDQWDWVDARNYLATPATPTGEKHYLFARMWVSHTPKGAHKAVLWPVRDGLLLEPTELAGAPRGTRAVATVADLNLDMEGQQVVHDQAYRDFAEQIVVRLSQIV